MKLNLGSGFRPQPDHINLDIRPEVNPDIVCNIEEGLPFKDNCLDVVMAFDVLEHIHLGKTVEAIEEIYRVLKPEGRLSVFVPSTEGRGAFQDPTHVSFWNQNSWLYYMDDAHRNLYGIKAKFTGHLQDVVNNSYEQNKVVHTKGELYAVK